MAKTIWSKMTKQNHDPVHFLLRRSLCPEPRQMDHLLRQRIALAQDLHWKDFKGHYGCVNAIEFSNGSGELIASGGDDRRVLLWPVEKMLSDIGTPAVMKGEHNSNIFCLAFDLDNKTVFSGGNDEQVIVHDIQTGETKDVFPHEDAVYGLSADPCNPSVFASACDDGRLLIFDIRDSTAEPFCVANYTSSMHSVMYNPIEPRLLATANGKEGVGLWDVRKPKSCVLRYGGGYVQQSCMSVRFSQHGDQIIALRRRLPPVLYKIDSHMPVCEFDHAGYYNSCTMKSISFAGDNDQYVLSGSDDFNLYMWAIPDDLSERLYINSAHMVLRAHRSIVNQVRFNPANHLIISSGVEKIVKVWSPFRLPSTNQSVGKDVFKERPVYSHEDYINLVLRNGSMMTHNYTEASTEEDPRMIAFFDSLVQRELEGWSSDDTLSSDEEEMYNRIVQLSSSDTDSTLSSISTINDSLDDVGVPQSDTNDISDISEPGPVTDTSTGGLGISGSTSAACSSASRSRSNDEDMHPNSSAKKGKKLSKLIQKKKEGLKDSFYRNRARLTLSSSSESSSEDEPSSTVIQNASPRKSNKGKHTIAVQNLMKQRQQAMQQSFVKLKRLKTLRNRVLNSDSDTEVAVGTKEKGQSITNDENEKGKDIKTIHKAKRHTETASIGPYVHEMCHMFEASSPTEPVCSTSSGYSSYASSDHSKCKSSANITVQNEETKTENSEKSKWSSSSIQSENGQISQQDRSKWKPIGSNVISSNYNNNNYHNNTSCDSNQISIVINKPATSELHYTCDTSHQKHCDNGTVVLDTDSATDTSGLEKPVDSLNDRNSGIFKYAHSATHFANKIDHNFSNIDGLEFAEDSKTINIPERIEDTNDTDLQVKEEPASVPGSDVRGKEIFDGTNENYLFLLPSQHKLLISDPKNSDNLSKYKTEINIGQIEDSNLNIATVNNSSSVPSCSTESFEPPLLIDHKQDSSEISRSAWTEFKKRRKSEESRKHYRGHKRSERNSNWD